MTVTGTVREWHAEEGWGVIDSPATPGGCWAHFSSVLTAGYKSLDPRGRVELTFEAAEQDGYAFRAVEVRAAGQEPLRDAPVVHGPSPTFESSLTLIFDDEEDTIPQ